MNKFKVDLTRSEEALMAYWIVGIMKLSSGEGIRGSIKGLCEAWKKEFKFPITPNHVNSVLSKYAHPKFKGFLKGTAPERNCSRKIPVIFEAIKLETAFHFAQSDLERHAKEYLNWKYKNSLEEVHSDFLIKASQMPANKKAMAVLSKYLSNDSNLEYSYTTPEAMTLAVKEGCWFCNPVNFLLRPDPKNPLCVVPDDSKFLSSVSSEERRLLKELANNPLVKQWKKIGAETPLFDIEALEALKFLKENPMVPLVFRGGMGQGFCWYLRFNDSLSRFEGIHDGLMAWRPREFSAYFLTTTFRSCTEGELRKYFEGYQGPDPEEDCFC